jgi:uncharacterized damage-inducible protein DinB
MRQIVHDLVKHQSWADAIHWNAFERFPAAINDRIIIDRQFHIHLVQRGFLHAIQELDFQMPAEETKEPGRLKAYAIETYELIWEYFKEVTENMLSEKVIIPWFKDPELEITRARAIMQMTTHSHYHRGQNATRLRELGGDPPLTDLIIWYWKGEPDPEWNSATF